MVISASGSCSKQCPHRICEERSRRSKRGRTSHCLHIMYGLEIPSEAACHHCDSQSIADITLAISGILDLGALTGPSASRLALMFQRTHSSSDNNVANTSVDRPVPGRNSCSNKLSDLTQLRHGVLPMHVSGQGPRSVGPHPACRSSSRVHSTMGGICCGMSGYESHASCTRRII